MFFLDEPNVNVLVIAAVAAAAVIVVKRSPGALNPKRVERDDPAASRTVQDGLEANPYQPCLVPPDQPRQDNPTNSTSPVVIIVWLVAIVFILVGLLLPAVR